MVEGGEGAATTADRLEEHHWARRRWLESLEEGRARRRTMGRSLDEGDGAANKDESQTSADAEQRRDRRPQPSATTNITDWYSTSAPRRIIILFQVMKSACIRALLFDGALFKNMGKTTNKAECFDEKHNLLLALVRRQMIRFLDLLWSVLRMPRLFCSEN